MNCEDPHHQWYRPNIAKPTDQSSDSNPKPTPQVTWSDDTKPASSSGSTTPSNPREFQLGMDLKYCDGKGNIVVVVYEGASADSLTHTIRLEYRSKIQIHDRNLQIIGQPD